MGTIEDLAYRINDRARAVLDEDGTHALMLFLRTPDGGVHPQLVGGATRDEMPKALSRIAEEVARREADGVVVVGEAWRAPIDPVAIGGAAESLQAEDILFVAALDAAGNELSLETPLRRTDDRHVTLGETEKTSSRSPFLNDVRRLWGITPTEG